MLTRTHLSASNHLPLSPALRRVARAPRVYRTLKLGEPAFGRSEFQAAAPRDPLLFWERRLADIWGEPESEALKVLAKELAAPRLRVPVDHPARDARPETTKEILCHLEAGKTVCLRGPQQMGKTSQAKIASQVLWERAREPVVLKIFCRFPIKPLSIKALNHLLRKAIVQAASESDRLPKMEFVKALRAASKDSTGSILHWLDQWLAAYGLRAVLHLDETARVLPSVQTAAYLCENISALKQCYRLIDLHGYQTNDALLQMLPEAVPVWVRPLPLAAAASYVRQLVALRPNVFSGIEDDACLTLAKYAGGRMLVIAEMLQECIDAYFRNAAMSDDYKVFHHYFPMVDGRYFLSAAGMLKYVQNATYLHLQRIDAYNSEEFRHISLKQRELLEDMAQNSPNVWVETEVHDADLRFLYAMSFLDLDANGHYQILGDNWREWLLWQILLRE